MSPSAEPRAYRASFLGIAGSVVLVFGLLLGLHQQPGETARDNSRANAVAATVLPPVRHVFVVNIENKGFGTTWGAHSAAPYLAKTLRAKGVLLTQYYGTAHHSLGNYLAQISGQGPDLDIQHDCPVYSGFEFLHPDAPFDSDGQAVGDGCVFPANVPTLAGQLDTAGYSWRGYLQDMARPCQHPRLGARDSWFKATRHEQYATRHNPFMYFRSITSRPAYCKSHVKPLAALTHDLERSSSTRSLSYITPDLCHDAHDPRCAGGGPGGLRAANSWFKEWVPKILRSPAYRAGGMLVITADESEGATEDSRGCCGEGPGPNAGQPGLDGFGGGRVGALVISPFVVHGSSSTTAYNHYSLLGSIEDLFGLDRLGYAQTEGTTFGADVYRTG